MRSQERYVVRSRSDNWQSRHLGNHLEQEHKSERYGHEDRMISTTAGLCPADELPCEPGFFSQIASQHPFQSCDSTMKLQWPKQKRYNCNFCESEELRTIYMFKGTREKLVAAQIQGGELVQSPSWGSCTLGKRVPHWARAIWHRGTVNDNSSQFKATGVYEENTVAQGQVEMKNISGMKRYRGESNRKDLSSEGNSWGKKKNKSRSHRQCRSTTQGNFMFHCKQPIWVRTHQKPENMKLKRSLQTPVLRRRDNHINNDESKVLSYPSNKTARVNCQLADSLRPRSVTLSNTNKDAQGTKSSCHDVQEDNKNLPLPDRKNSTKVPISQNECSSHPFETISEKEPYEVSLCQPNRRINFSSNKQLSFVVTNENENLEKAEPNEVIEWAGRRIFEHENQIHKSSHKRKTSTYHPCYITDNVETIMSFLSLIEIIKTKRVSRIWKVAASSTLRRRKIDNLCTTPLLTANAGTQLLSKVHTLLPRLQCLTINCGRLSHLKGVVLSYILKCQNLVFLRLENFVWSDLTIATNEILSPPPTLKHGHAILCMLLDLELPNSTMPITAGTHCMRPLSKLFPNLRSLTVRSAQDMMIFSLRLFFPSVRNLFLLDTLWTTRKFAQIISSTPKLMKFLRKGQKVSTVSSKVTKGSDIHTSSCNQITRDFKSVPHFPRMHKPGSVPVTPSDRRLTALICNGKQSLYVEPLGRVRMIETGKALTNKNIRMFAAFCALIGVMIIMPPFDG